MFYSVLTTMACSSRRARRRLWRVLPGEVQGQEDLQCGWRQGGRHGPHQDEVEPHRPHAQQPGVRSHGMAAQLAKLRTVDVEYKSYYGGLLWPMTTGTCLTSS